MEGKKFKVVITDSNFIDTEMEKNVLSEIDCEVINAQAKCEEELIQACRDADGLIVQYAPITEKVINNMTKCKVISRYGIGVDTIDVKAAKSKGIKVCNVPDYCINEVADHCLALILGLGRKVVKLANSVRNGIWDAIGVGKPIFNLKTQILGLIGFGKIPQNLYPKVRYIFKDIFVYDPFISEDLVKQYNIKMASFYGILRSCDFISIHCPLNETTKYLFSKREFQLMKPTAYIINTSRGAIINTSELYQAIGSGLIAGAGLDVLEKEPPGMDFELSRFDNVIITPHASFYSESALDDLKYKTALNVLKILKGEEAINVVS
jgi:D-3-phosphoglycerate dehydrogenase